MKKYLLVEVKDTRRASHRCDPIEWVWDSILGNGMCNTASKGTSIKALWIYTEDGKKEKLDIPTKAQKGTI